MVTDRTLLVLLASVVIMLVGCKEPVGLPNNDVHAATTQTVYCYVDTVEIRSGYVSMWAGYMTPESAFAWDHTKITRGYHVQDNRPFPNNYGYCTFQVPHFIPIETPVCTLFYYQSAHNGSVNLDVNWLDVRNTLDWNPEFLYHAADTSSCIVTSDVAQTDGWHKVALTQDGCNKLVLCATQQEGGPFVTGWIYTGSINNNDSATVSLPSNGPYIKVVYDDGQ